MGNSENVLESTAPVSTQVARPEEVERRICEIWSRVLEHSSFRANDNFYEVGGDSLKAVNLVASLEIEFSISLSATQLYDAPTIAEQVRVICHESGFRQEPDTDRAIFEMRRGDSPTPLFCFPGNDGGIASFHPLVERLDPELGVQVVLYTALERGGPAPSMEEFAATCVEAIVRVQPSGPYHLAGFCFGASVAYEVARLLRAGGEEVATLALVEVEPGFASWPLRSRMTYRKRKFTSWIRSVFIRKPRAAAPPSVQPSSAAVPDKNGRMPDKIARIQMAAHSMLWNYKHRRYGGRVLLFCGVHGNQHTDLAYWRELAGEAEVLSVPGTHFTILQEPNVASVAEILQGRLSESYCPV